MPGCCLGGSALEGPGEAATQCWQHNRLAHQHRAELHTYRIMIAEMLSRVTVTVN